MRGLDSRPLADRLVDRIRAEVESGALPPGGAVSQVALAARYGVSHVPLREALRQLESEGFVVQRPYRRAVVRPLSAAEALEVGETLALVDAHLLRHAGPRVGQDGLRRLDEIVRAIDRAPDGRRASALWDEWSDHLFSHAGRPLALDVGRRLRRIAKLYWRTCSPSARERAGGVAALRRLLRLLRDGRTEAAAGILEDGYRSAAARISAALAAGPGTARRDDRTATASGRGQGPAARRPRSARPRSG